MNQPKFKFGDKVVGKKNESFVISQICLYRNVYRNGTFMYSFEGGNWFLEDSLQLYQEPKNKKLYAYSREDLVVFTKNEKVVQDLKFLGANFKRDKDHDIDFEDLEYISKMRKEV